jgi:hypothetical protein
MIWMAMALFVPEIVLFAAYSQYSEASKLVKALNAFRSHVQKDRGRKEKDRWDDLIPKKDLDVVAAPGVVKPIGTSDCMQDVKASVLGKSANEIIIQKGTNLADTKHPKKVKSLKKALRSLTDSSRTRKCRSMLLKSRHSI